MHVTWDGADQAGWQVLDLAGADDADLTAARKWAETRLGTLGELPLIDTLIVSTELLENAYRHAGGPLQLRLHQRSDEVTVAVSDGGASEPRLRDPDTTGGRGLLLVDRLCRAWGVSRHDEGKLVWGRLGWEDPGLG